MSEPTNAIRTAIECLTLWLEGDDPEARILNASYIAGLINDPDGPGPTEMVSGVLNLGLYLLLDLMKEQGADPPEDVDRARSYLQELALQLG
jgi:hypothetical protein